MKANILDGRALARKNDAQLMQRIEALRTAGVEVCLAVLLVGNNPASEAYVRNKMKKAAALGIAVRLERREEGVAEAELLRLIDACNADARVHGILVQLPLPAHVDRERVLMRIAPHKDVDGLHTLNIGALASGREGFIPCTPKGVMRLIGESGVRIEGSEAVVVGRSNLVGKPSALLLLQRNATVTLCHSHTRGLGEITRRADILVCAAGQPGLIRAGMVKEGAVVIDVGQCRVDGAWCGDVDFDAVAARAAHITPVPGGVGPMTIAMLMENTVEAAEKAKHA